MGMTEQEDAETALSTPADNMPGAAEEAKNPLLVALGERVRNLRAQRGLTRKAVAVGDFTTRSPEWLLIRELLEHRSEPELRRARLALHELLSGGGSDTARHRRIALIGLRGAGKSTLGPPLAP